MATAGILVVGNEVLSGKVEEQNARYLISELRRLGVDLQRVVVVRDDVEIIARDVAQMSATFDHVFTSGGVGATHDDVTMAGIARGLGVGLERNPTLQSLLEAHYKARVNDAVLSMADVPCGAVLLGERELLYPVVSIGNIYVLPGVPSFLRAKFEFLRGRLADVPIALKSVYVSVGEDRLADLLRAVLDAHPGLEIGSYPRFDDADHRVKITVESRDAGLVARGVEALLERLDPATVVRIEDGAAPV